MAAYALSGVASTCVGAGTLLHLFSGVQQWRDCGHVLHVEKENGGDLLSNDIFGMVLEAVLAGGVEGCVAGPPCNTSSACRTAADGGPRQVRARDGPERYGMSSNTPQEQAGVDDATVLWFRTFLVFLLIKAIKGPQAFLGLEHPQDPSEWSDAQSPLQACPSIWSFPEKARLRQLLQAWVAKFDQGCFSHPRRKPTSFLTTNWVIYEHLDGHRCPANWKSQVDERSFAGPSSLSLASESKYPSASWARLVAWFCPCCETWLEAPLPVKCPGARGVRCQPAYKASSPLPLLAGTRGSRPSSVQEGL